MKRTIVSCVVFLFIATGCNTATDGDATAPYASRYKPLASDATLLQGATVLTGTGERLDDADVLMRDGRIAAIGSNIDATGASVVSTQGGKRIGLCRHSHAADRHVEGFRVHRGPRRC